MGNTSLNWEKRNKIIEASLARIKDDYMANIKDVSQDLKIDMSYKDDAVIIASKLTENGEYTWELSELNHWPYVYKNPNYDLKISNIKLNKTQRVFLYISGVIAFITMVFIGLSTYFQIIERKEKTKDQTQQELKSIHKELKQQNTSLIELNLSIQRLIDSLP